MIAISCQCGRTYQLDDQFAGRRVQCRQCGKVLAVPHPPAPSTLTLPQAADSEREAHTPIISVGKHPHRSTVRTAAEEAVGDGRSSRYVSHGHYDMVRAVAQGGMGKVSIARDRALNRDVALKELLGNVADIVESERRFVAEAEITAQLAHPGVVPIYALGTDHNGKPFYAMRLIEGQTLQQAVDEYHKSGRPLELRNLLRRFVMVCQTVAYAHDRGIIHRDLKPANIMLGGFGETLVMDWGLAKPVRDGRSEDSTLGALAYRQLAEQACLTDGNDVVGTAAYMPPEQALGEIDKLGAASDVYGLGAILYQILTGTPPYSGNSSAEILQLVKNGAPPKPRTVCRSIPVALEAICLKAMAREARNRFRTAIELAENVQRWLDDEQVPAYAEPFLERCYRWSRRHKAIVASGAIATILATLVGSVATVVYQRERDKSRALQRLADDYRQQAVNAQQEADEKEAEADRLAKEAEASRRAATAAMHQEAKAQQEAKKAQEKVTALEAEIAVTAIERGEILKRLEAARAELTTAQASVEAESQRAAAAVEQAAAMERQVVALRREADEYRAIALKLTQSVAEMVDPKQAPSVQANTPWEDLAQRDAALFDVVASDRSEGSVASDTMRLRSGRQSLRISTKSGGGVCITYPRSRNANWDLSLYEHLSLAFVLEDPTGSEIRNEGLIVRIGRDSQCIEYRAAPEVLAIAPKGWVSVKIPLAGNALWSKKEINPLELSRVDWLQVCFTTGNPRVAVWLDDLCFGSDPRQIRRELVPDLERSAAEYVVAMQGELNAWVSGREIPVRTRSDVPDDPFKVLSVNLNGKSDVTNEGLKFLGGLMDCRALLLVGTSITDGGLKHLKDMKSLSHLEIGNNRLSDEGIASITAMPHLSFVTVGGTNVSEKGLRQLGSLPTGLQGLGLSASNAPSGIAFLAGCPLHWIGVDLDPASRQMSDAFAESLTRFPTLKELSFVNLDVTESQARYIGQINGLTRLSFVASSGWSDHAFSHLAHLANLEMLSIIRTDSIIKDTDLSPLVALKRLKTLELESDSIQPAAVLKLQAALSDCEFKLGPELQRALDVSRTK